MNAARNRSLALVAGVTFALSAAVALCTACGVDGTTPDCTSPDSGCGVVADGSVIPPNTDAGDSAADAATDVAQDATETPRDGASDARSDAADAGPRDARADG